MFEKVIITNPKRNTINNGHEGWYPYYAGYSSEFVSKLLKTSTISEDASIIDPWNGSGTTTTVANNLGFRTHGFDLNPVMVIAAKACLVNRHDFTSLKPISKRILDLAAEDNSTFDFQEPLCIWFRPSNAAYFRRIERAIQKLLINYESYSPLSITKSFDQISSIAAFFYVALFRTVNSFLIDFRPSNPTWIKVPKNIHTRKAPSYERISLAFAAEVNSMLESVSAENIINNSHHLTNISIATSCNLPLDTSSVDLIISSPPYCTRIDYAVATMPELTILGYNPETNLQDLRRSLIGASTVPLTAPVIDNQWGNTCIGFLDQVYNHISKASKTYYFKSHAQYFDSIFKSMIEIERVLKTDGVCTLVVQDSYYKNIYNNLPQIFSEMANNVGLELIREEYFVASKNMAKRNPGVKKYRTNITASESVLCFKK